MRAALVVLFAAFIAVSAQAQISTTPAHPVAGVPFVIHVVFSPICDDIGSATVNGSNIDLHLLGLAGIPECVVERNVTVGPLAAGAYTVRGFPLNNSTSPTMTQIIMVGADVPALDPRVLALLAVALIVIALLRIPPG